MDETNDYCKQDLRYSNVKSYRSIKDYFYNIDILLDAIIQYHKKAQIRKNEKTLLDLLKIDFV